MKESSPDLQSAALEFALARASFLDAKQARNSLRCEFAWKDKSGAGQSDLPCYYGDGDNAEDYCEPCKLRAEATKTMCDKSKISSSAWIRFRRILRKSQASK